MNETEEDRFYKKIKDNVKKLYFNAKITLTIERSKIKIDNLELLLRSLARKEIYSVCKSLHGNPTFLSLIFSKNPIEKGLENPFISI